MHGRYMLGACSVLRVIVLNTVHSRTHMRVQQAAVLQLQRLKDSTRLLKWLQVSVLSLCCSRHWNLFHCSKLTRKHRTHNHRSRNDGRRACMLNMYSG